MKKTIAYLMFVLFITPSLARGYPLEDSDFLRAAYCFYMSTAPRLEVDLSEMEKEEGQRKFIDALFVRDLEFPQGEDYEAVQRKFMTWVVPRFQNESTTAALTWYRDNCLSIEQ